MNAVRKLTRESLAPRAAQYDASASHPTENWHDLREHGLLALTIPRAYGELELDPLTYIMVMEEIAKGCANTAMTLHMHCSVLSFIKEMGTPEQRSKLYREVVEEGKLFGSWGSEPPVSLGRNLLVETSIKPADGGYLVSGVKHFCTMAGAASYYMTWCALNGSEDMDTGLVMALVPADSEGLTVVGGWDCDDGSGPSRLGPDP